MARTGKYVVEYKTYDAGWRPSGNFYDGPYFDDSSKAEDAAQQERSHPDNFAGLVYRVRSVRRMDFVQEVVNKVSFPDYTFKVEELPPNAVFVRGEYWEPDTVTGENELQKTRLWLIADTDTEDEIVRTLFKLVMTSMEHKAREWFKYDGYSVMNPHFSVQQYKKLMEEHNNA